MVCFEQRAVWWGWGPKGFVLEVIGWRCGEQQLNFVVLPQVWGSLVL